VVQGGRGLDVGDTVRLKLVSADPEKGHVDFVHEGGDVDRKLERSRRKKIAAGQLKSKIGQSFDAEVTGVTPNGTWVRLADGSAEGRVMQGSKGLTKGQRVRVKLTNTDTVHGFIDFAVDSPGVAPKVDRLKRKQDAARQLQGRVGRHFTAVVTGANEKAVWVKTDDGVEGRLVRGCRGATVGDRMDVVLLRADPQNGFIDFAHQRTTIPV
jgi:exoribonuclease R